MDNRKSSQKPKTRNCTFGKLEIVLEELTKEEPIPNKLHDSSDYVGKGLELSPIKSFG